MRMRALRTTLAAMLAVVAVTAVFTGSALAIRHGSLDGTDHPFVGIMVAQDADGDPLWRCTGTLLSDTVFLTAGHCVESPAARIEIWFDGRPRPARHRIPGSRRPSVRRHQRLSVHGRRQRRPARPPAVRPRRVLDSTTSASSRSTSPTRRPPTASYRALNSLDSLHVGRARDGSPPSGTASRPPIPTPQAGRTRPSGRAWSRTPG